MVEDNPDFYEPISELLEYEGLKVKVIPNSDLAIDFLSKINKYDLIILDLMFMKGKKISLEDVPEVGIYLYQKIRKIDNKIPIIVTTAMSRESCWKYFENDPNVSYQGKPILSNFNIFLNKILTLI